MALKTGTRVGPYEITAPLGAGGMGEVYRATDTKLKRDVAIKVLPEDVAGDRERLARFEREAHVLASLNHPHIASIYGLEESDGVPCLVLELVEGQTLAERLKEGPLPVDQTLELARQIASALEAAHEKGVIHRDLKPANIKITPEGTAKVLDFGLAKAFADESVEISGDASLSPTLTMAATRAGVILGTAAYMSPEQARGKHVDKRTDIWAFGCVLYEMLTGRQAFPGETVSDAIAMILEREADWEALPPTTPLKVRELLQRCLRKDNRNRLHDIADARIETEEALANPAGAFDAVINQQGHKMFSSRWVPWIVAVAAAAGLIWNTVRDVPTGMSKPIRASLELPAAVQVEVDSHPLAFSPDGNRLVVTVERDGRTQLYMRELTRGDFVPMPGTEGAHYPFFSPDGEWVGFTDFDDFRMKRVAVAGGEPIVICDKVDPGRGSWGSDDIIIFTRTWRGGLWRVPASGGAPEPIDSSGSVEGTWFDVWPQALPDRSVVLYTRVVGGSLDAARVMALSLETGERKTLVDGASFGRYAPSGHLLYVRETTLFAQPFDIGRLESTGPPVPVLDDVGVFVGIAMAHFTFSLDGTLAYLPQSLVAPPRQLVWVDRDGTERAATEQLGGYLEPSLSPDGRRLALLSGAFPSGDVWIHDFVRDTRTRLTLETEFQGGPIWTPDGQRVIYYRADPTYTLSWSPTDGSQPSELLYRGELDMVPTSVSPDGTRLAFHVIGHPDTGFDIWQIPLQGEREPTPLVRTTFAEWGAMFSRDGHWLAFSSNESGRSEVYVQAFPDSQGKIRISNDGGASPVWSRDGTELFYRSGSKTMAVDVETDPTFTAGKPRLLFTGRYRDQAYYRDYDVAPDGRFLMIKTPPELAARQVNVVLNWFEELERLAPTE
jgi:Tol biopolymer transport system component